jgi:hypothetical protein
MPHTGTSQNMMSPEGRRAVARAATLRRVRERLLRRAQIAPQYGQKMLDVVIPDGDFDAFLMERGW